MIAEHVTAFADLVDAVANVTVYADGKVPNSPTLPYVVIYGNQGMPENASMADVSEWQHFTAQTTCVATSQLSARALADRVQTALLDVRPTVAGRSSGQISKVSSQPVRVDNDVTPPLFYAVDVWSFTTVPS